MFRLLFIFLCLFFFTFSQVVFADVGISFWSKPLSSGVSTGEVLIDFNNGISFQAVRGNVYVDGVAAHLYSQMWAEFNLLGFNSAGYDLYVFNIGDNYVDLYFNGVKQVLMPENYSVSPDFSADSILNSYVTYFSDKVDSSSLLVSAVPFLPSQVQQNFQSGSGKYYNLFSLSFAFVDMSVVTGLFAGLIIFSLLVVFLLRKSTKTINGV